GILLYEMLTGVTPFSGENTASILYRQVHSPAPPIRSINPRLPQELQPVVDRALAKNPATRYADPLDLAHDLQEAARWLPPGSPWLGGRSSQVQSNGNRRNTPEGQGVLYSHKTLRSPTSPQEPVQDGYSIYRDTGSNRDGRDPRQARAISGRTVPAGKSGPRAMMLVFALLLLAAGGAVIAVAAGVLHLPHSASNSRFLAPGPATYTGPRRTDSGPDLHIMQALVPPTIDGDLSDWVGAPAGPFPADKITFIAPVKSVQWGGPDDLSATFNFAWDADNFYVATTVTDNIHIQLPTTRGHNLFNGDDIEIWFDTDLAGDFASNSANSDDYQLGISPGDFGALSPEAVFWNPSSKKSDKLAGIIKVAARKRPDGNGYTLEAAVPWSALGNFHPQPGAAIGFAASAGDNDQRRGPNQPPMQELMTSTVPRLQYQAPFTFGNLFF
ncbi:MAG: hypothetical protein M3014_05745, partial [Chloroflexota bacterium]|nr:hypothetical protein [Chloroflexota bacterium]